MDTLWTFVACNLIPLIAFLVGIAATIRILWGLGLRSEKVSEVFESALESPGVRSGMARFREVRPSTPEAALTEMRDLVGADRDTVLRAMEKAELKFWHRMRHFEFWAGVSRCLTVILAFVTLIYALSSLQALLVGLSLEIEHSAAAIVNVLHDILQVISRNIWVIFFLFVLNIVVDARIRGRKERWNIYVNQLRARAMREDM